MSSNEKIESEDFFIDLLRSAYREKKFRKVIETGKQALSTFSKSSTINEYVALGYLELGDDSSALAHLQTAIRQKSPMAGPWRATHRPLGRLGWDKDTELEFWIRCNNELEIAFEAARQLALEGKGSSAVEALSGVSSVFPEETWQRIERIIKILSGQAADPVRRVDGLSIPESPRLLFLSGTGFSGSSAVFDYLREFHDVVPVEGESPVFAQGPGSLLKVYLAADNIRGFRRRMVDFFFTYLIGFREIRARWDLLFMQNARNHVFGKDSQNYLGVLENLATLAIQAMESEDRSVRERQVRAMASIILTDILLGQRYDTSKLIALDNVVNVRYIDAVQMFQQSESFCVFRDPRSNYVAINNESSHYVPPVAEWVRMQKKKLSDLKANVNRLSAALGGNSMKRIQFEEFVLSEAYRDSLAEEVGLNLERRERHRYFKPWESLRNVVLHQEHPDQSEIAYIGQELTEFCCEPHVRMVAENPSEDG